MTPYFTSLSKRETYTFKIIGRGDSMSTLSMKSEQIEMGKTRIRSEIAYTGIPEALIRDSGWLDLLTFSPLMGQGYSPENVALLTAGLREYENLEMENSSWVIKSNNPLKGLWSAAKAIPVDITLGERRTKESQKRLELQYRFFTLMDLFDECHYYLKADTVDYHTLEALLQEVSHKTSLAYKKGFISQEELNDARGELQVVQNFLFNARASDHGSISQINRVKTHVFPEAQPDYEEGVRPPHPIPDLPPLPPTNAQTSERGDLPGLSLEERFNVIHPPHSRSILLPQIRHP